MGRETQAAINGRQAAIRWVRGIGCLENRVRGVHPPEMRSGEVNFLQIEIEYCGQ